MLLPIFDFSLTFSVSFVFVCFCVFVNILFKYLLYLFKMVDRRWNFHCIVIIDFFMF